jgi:hypothetical protein
VFTRETIKAFYLAVMEDRVAIIWGEKKDVFEILVGDEWVPLNYPIQGSIKMGNVTTVRDGDIVKLTPKGKQALMRLLVEDIEGVWDHIDWSSGDSRLT